MMQGVGGNLAKSYLKCMDISSNGEYPTLVSGDKER